MRLPFTVKSVKALPLPASGRRDYHDASVRGFGVRLSATGARTWFVLYRGKDRRLERLTIASATVMDLDEAREAARDVLARVRLGENPASDRRERRASARTERVDDSFSALATLYLDKHARKHKRSHRIDELAIARDLGTWKHRPAREIAPDDVQAVLERIEERGAPVQANRTRAIISKVFSWGLKSAVARTRFRLVGNPVQGTEKPTKEQPRERTLSPDELRRLWPAIEAEKPDIAAIWKLYLFTGQRGAEIRSMRREDVNVDSATWVIPAGRSKNGRSHVVPLSRPALEVVTAQMARHASIWLFPASHGAHEGKQRTPFRASMQKPSERLRATTGIDFWPHDLRRTCVTGMAELGIPREIIARVVNHSDRSVTGRVYDKYDRLPERRHALDAWARRLHQIVNGETTAAKVIPLRA